ncbi:MAG: nicotinate-nucleotide adenylyltransferase [Labilithrix sp.]|nr:nicotinate-nucleotide adenylyltransferase [Labilithrix sp.]
MAKDVADTLGLERVLWIPAGDPPHKSGPLTSSATRLEMVRAAVTADPRFDVSTIEIDRAGPSYMVETLRELRRTLPEAELFLIVGADQFASFATWREPDSIVRLARLAVMDRAGDRATDVQPGVPVGDLVLVPVRRVDVSSTDIRARKRAGEDIRDSVPPGVHTIIERERLYSGP